MSEAPQSNEPSRSIKPLRTRRLTPWQQRKLDIKTLKGILKNGGLLRNHKPLRRKKKSERPGRQERFGNL